MFVIDKGNCFVLFQKELEIIDRRRPTKMCALLATTNDERFIDIQIGLSINLTSDFVDGLIAWSKILWF
jgi:hypothetical protein